MIGRIKFGDYAKIRQTAKFNSTPNFPAILYCMYICIGTLIDAELARQFAVATGSSVCQHDLSIPSLAADYDPFLDMR